MGVGQHAGGIQPMRPVPDDLRLVGRPGRSRPARARRCRRCPRPDAVDGGTSSPAAIRTSTGNMARQSSVSVPVTRIPASGVAGRGWVASGPPGADRLPVPTYPTGLRWLPAEGAGEVQTPLRGPGTAQLRMGDRVCPARDDRRALRARRRRAHVGGRSAHHHAAHLPRRGPGLRLTRRQANPGGCWDRWVSERPCRARRPGGASTTHIRSRPYPRHTEE
jgi:hypothetical protein